MHPQYWADALSTATYLFNLHPTKTLHNSTPFRCLHGRPPSYNHLRVFGCLCYPNLSATTTHKLAPRSIECVLLGYPSHHKGYKCLDLKNNSIILSRHIVFDKTFFPFAKTTSPSQSTYTFLEHDDPVFWSLAGPGSPGVLPPSQGAPAVHTPVPVTPEAAPGTPPALRPPPSPSTDATAPNSSMLSAAPAGCAISSNDGPLPSAQDPPRPAHLPQCRMLQFRRQQQRVTRPTRALCPSCTSRTTTAC